MSEAETDLRVAMMRRLVPDGAEVVVLVDNGYAGTKPDRPAYQRLVELVTQGKLAGISVASLSELWRSATLASRFLGAAGERGIPVVTASGIATDARELLLAFEISAAVNGRLAVRKAKRNQKAAMTTRVEISSPGARS